MAHTARVPFVDWHGRRALTEEQLENDPDLRAFVDRFPASFERALDARVWLLIEEDR